MTYGRPITKSLDVTIVCPDGKPCRPWLTAVIDDFSRAVPGYYIGIEAPSILRTALAFRQAIWKKTDPQWMICGLPGEFYSDSVPRNRIGVMCPD